jgi:hypothetical protein
MIAKPIRTIDELLQPAACHYIDIRRSSEIPRPICVETVARSLHPLRRRCKSRRKVLCRREIGCPTFLIEQKDPPGLKPEQCRHLRQRGAERLIEIDRPVQLARYLVEDEKLAGVEIFDFGFSIIQIDDWEE